MGFVCSCGKSDCFNHIRTNVLKSSVQTKAVAEHIVLFLVAVIVDLTLID